MLHHPDRRSEPEARLPIGASAADAIAIGVLLVAAYAALHPFDVPLFGVPLRIRRWGRPLSLALAIIVVRHLAVATPSLAHRLWRLVGRAAGGLAVYSPRHRSFPRALALTVSSMLSLAIVAHGYDGTTYLRGDCPYYYWTAVAILDGHGLDLSHELPGGWREHVNQIALSVDGRPVPKHPVVMPILSLPFIAAFGQPGALVFNLVQMTILLNVLYNLALAVARPLTASVAVIVTFAGSVLPHYVWNFSPDLCATMLLMAGTWTVYASERTRGWVWGGVLLGAACVAKVPLFLFLPGTLLLLPRSFWRPAFSVAAGAAIPLVAFAVMNVHLFGSPIVTSYDRIAALAPDGQPTVYSQRSSFDLPIEEGIRGQLFDREHGLLTTSPVTLLALVGLPFCFIRRPRLSAQLVVTSIALFFLFSTYDQWDASHYGNRFLMPLIASFVVPLAAGFDRLTGHVVALPRPDLA